MFCCFNLNTSAGKYAVLNDEQKWQTLQLYQYYKLKYIQINGLKP